MAMGWILYPRDKRIQVNIIKSGVSVLQMLGNQLEPLYTDLTKDLGIAAQHIHLGLRLVNIILPEFHQKYLLEKKYRDKQNYSYNKSNN